MKIKTIEFRNFASYGNKLQKIEFEDNTGNFYLVLGQNGSGKCLDKKTKIEILFEDNKQKERFKKFINSKTRLDI